MITGILILVVILECLDGPLDCIDIVIICLYKLPFDFVGLEVFFIVVDTF